MFHSGMPLTPMMLGEDITGIEESTVLIGDQIYNGKYVPAEELEKAFKTWDKQPVVMNHSRDLEDEVGYIDVTNYYADEKKLKMITCF